MSEPLTKTWLRSHAQITFLGVSILQFWVDLVIWERLLNAYHDRRAIIEFGTHAGGLSTFLFLQTIQRDMKFWTFDIHRPPDTPLLNFIGLLEHFHQGDLFTEKTEAYVRSILKRDDIHPLILYCDDGHKVNEVDFYLPHLRVNDLIGVHDFGTEVGKDWMEKMYGDKLEPVFHAECEELGSITRFWKVRF